MRRLDEALAHKLTLIAAPPGYGKTTLLSIWVSEHNLPAAWLSLDVEDNDPALFLQYFIVALQSIAPQAGQASLEMLKSPQLSPQPPILSSLINDLADIQNDFVFILDDYHWIEQQEIHDSITYLIDHLPPRMHLVIASRSDPPLLLSRLRTRNQLLEIRQSDLRMKPEEAGEFLNHCMGLNLSSAQVETLESRTEGWIAGLQLAALSLRNKGDIDSFLQSFGGSHRYVIDYLADEVLSQQTADMQTFLKQISILNRFSAPLCNAITDHKDSADLLRQLEESNVFLIPLDDQREWFRFHQLFRDYLLTGLSQEESIPLHVIASRWFLSQGYYSEAVNHAFSSQDLDLAIHTISKAAAPAMEKAAFISLNGWLEKLPDNLIRQNAVLALYKSFLLFFTQTYQAAESYALAAEENMPPEAPAHLRGQLMSLQSQLAVCQDQLDLGIKFARDALEYLDEQDFFFRNLTLNVLGQILELKGDVTAASEVYQQGFTSGYQYGERLGTMVIFTNLIFSLNELGRRREAVSMCQKIDAEIGAETLAGRHLTDVISLSWSLLSYEADQLQLAHQQAQRALDTLNRSGITQGVSWAQYILARIYMINEEWDMFQRVTQEGIDLASRIGSSEIQGSWFTALKAQASMLSGDLQSAERWAESQKYTPGDKPHHWVEYSYFTYARLLISQNRVQDAKQLLETIENSALGGKRWRKLITVHLLMALAELRQGERSSAINHFEQALSIAAPENYKRVILDEGPQILDLLPEVRHIAPKFVDELLAKSRKAVELAQLSDSPYEPLSEREMEVLNLVARGYSNRQIAEALFVTLGTVKKHLNNVFSKFQVKNRTQAVARARDLGLLK